MTSPPPPPPPPPPSAPGTPRVSARGAPSSAGLLGSNLHLALAARKDLPITPSTKMKQLQWDKLPQQQVGKTLWNIEEPSKEHEMLTKLQIDGVWMQMEEDFKAKQLVINLMAKQKRAELRSVLDPVTKKNVEILIQKVKKLQPEEIAWKIEHFDQDLCTQTFLRELQGMLPNPEQIGKLNVYRNSGPEELAGLHPADRLMVKLIQIERLGPRIKGMLYRTRFDESHSSLDDDARKLAEAGQSLLDAKAFKEVLNLILLIGNYMNGTGIKGGAFGFRVSSINKLVDTKSVNNTTLLHFLERTINRHFPDMEKFLEELAKPAEAYRVNLQESRKSLGELREGLQSIRLELEEHHMNPDEKYGTMMWNFFSKAKGRVADLVDDLNQADTIFSEVVAYYGEDDKNMSSSEFYGIFKTFVTSYQNCKAYNEALVQEQLAVEKRKQAAEEFRANRQKAIETSAEDSAVLDNLLERLRNGENVGRRARRARPQTTGENGGTIPVIAELQDDQQPEGSDDAADIARVMLARLQSDGFAVDMHMPSTPTVPSRRPRRLKADVSDDDMSQFLSES